MKLLLRNTLIGCTASLALAAFNAANAAVIDDFNIDEGHFATHPTYSGTTVGITADSTADRVTTDSPKEGAGHERVVLIYNGTGTTVRCRFLSGVGAPANNTPFTTTSGTDGWIGYYLRTTNSGWVTSLNLDGPDGMDGSPDAAIIADGQWHLYEWDLDATTVWGPVPGIGGGHGGALPDGTFTIDSIYFRFTNSLPATIDATSVFYMDFVAVNPAGSVSNLLVDPCHDTPGIAVDGPLGADTDQVTVVGATNTATAINVYQDSVLIGSKTSGIVDGNNSVTVSGLVKGGAVAATQVVNGQESCMPDTMVYVGGGANPSVRVALSIRETSGTGPIGDPNPDSPVSSFIHFMGATSVSGGAPLDAAVIYPSNDWQTLTFSHVPVTAPAPANVTGTPAAGIGYVAGDNVTVEVYAIQSLGYTNIFSSVSATSAVVNIAGDSTINWSWAAVPGAFAYRLQRDYNGGTMFYEYVDVTNVTTFADDSTKWQWLYAGDPFYGDDNIPDATNGYSMRSVLWNSADTARPIGTLDDIETPWGIFEAIGFCINDGDTGPFDLYIDTLQNGSTVFQDFDSVAAGTTDFGLRSPSLSTTTSGALLTTPDIGVVSDNAADTGLNSFRVSYQWNGTNATKWLRLTTSGAGDPMVDLSKPISFRLLMVPVGGSLPQGPPKDISVTRSGNDIILNWEGSYYLQAADSVNGTFSDISAGPIAGPYTYTITPGAPMKFFRLRQ